MRMISLKLEYIYSSGRDSQPSDLDLDLKIIIVPRSIHRDQTGMLAEAINSRYEMISYDLLT